MTEISIDRIIHSPEQFKHIRFPSGLSFSLDIDPNQNLARKRISSGKEIYSFGNNKNITLIDRRSNSHLEFETVEGTNHIVIKVIDTNSGELIRRIPQLEIRQIENDLGFLIDEKV